MPPTLPAEVFFAGARLPISMTSEGVQIGRVDAEYNGLAWVACSAAKGTFPIEPVRRGEDARQDALYAIRPDSSHELSAPREAWIRLSGTDPGEDVYLVGTSFIYEEILVPRAALLLLFDELLRLRREFPIPLAP